MPSVNCTSSIKCCLVFTAQAALQEQQAMERAMIGSALPFGVSPMSMWICLMFLLYHVSTFLSKQLIKATSNNHEHFHYASWCVKICQKKNLNLFQKEQENFFSDLMCTDCVHLQPDYFYL